MKINEIQEGADREYLSLPKEDIERLRAKFLPDWEYKDNIFPLSSYFVHF